MLKLLFCRYLMIFQPINLKRLPEGIYILKIQEVNSGKTFVTKTSKLE